MPAMVDTKMVIAETIVSIITWPTRKSCSRRSESLMRVRIQDSPSVRRRSRTPSSASMQWLE